MPTRRVYLAGFYSSLLLLEQGRCLMMQVLRLPINVWHTLRKSPLQALTSWASGATRPSRKRRLLWDSSDPYQQHTSTLSAARAARCQHRGKPTGNAALPIGGGISIAQCCSNCHASWAGRMQAFLRWRCRPVSVNAAAPRWGCRTLATRANFCGVCTANSHLHRP